MLNLAPTSTFQPGDAASFVETFFPGAKQRPNGQWLVCCPAHNDKQPSLSIAQGNKGILLTCFAGCTHKAICDALDIRESELFTPDEKPHTNGKSQRREIGRTSYPYRDEAGQTLYRKIRVDYDNGDKFYPQERLEAGQWVSGLGNVRRVLYRLPELLRADPGEPVYWVEGEKCCEDLARRGLVSTTSGSTTSWRNEFASFLAGRVVVILPDNDAEGVTHAETVARALSSVASQVIVVNLPGLAKKQDVFDWLRMGHTVDDLVDLAASADPWQSSPAPVAVTQAASEPRTLLTLYAFDYPPLPASVDLPAGPASHTWLETYVKHAQTVSPMTPRLFHESAGLWLLSVAIARRLMVNVGFGPIYPNLYLVWIAPTTLHRKTTALEVARSLARRVFPHLLAAQDTTPEAFLSDLAGREPANYEKMTSDQKDRWLAARNFAAQRGWLLDELSGLLASAGKDYNAGLIEALLRFYDCTPYSRSTQKQGWMEIDDPYLSLLGASTPAALAQHLLVERLWSDGFWPRFALLTPEAERPDWVEPTEVAEPKELAPALSGLYHRLPRPAWPDTPKALNVTVDPDALALWRRYNRALSHTLLTPDVDRRLWGAYGRLPTHALKVAMIYAALEWPSVQAAPHIEVGHMGQALRICETWRASAHRALELASQTGYDEKRRRILRQLSRHEPRGATLRDLCRSMRDLKPDDVGDTLRQLVTSGDVDEMPSEATAHGGRPTSVYRIAH